MAETTTGSGRLRAGLAAGWTLAHKTGTGAEVGRVSLGTNDVGLLTAPDGRTFAVAVLVAGVTLPFEDRERLIAEVARVVSSPAP